MVHHGKALPARESQDQPLDERGYSLGSLSHGGLDGMEHCHNRSWDVLDKPWAAGVKSGHSFVGGESGAGLTVGDLEAVGPVGGVNVVDCTDVDAVVDLDDAEVVAEIAAVAVLGVAVVDAAVAAAADGGRHLPSVPPKQGCYWHTVRWFEVLDSLMALENGTAGL